MCRYERSARKAFHQGGDAEIDQDESRPPSEEPAGAFRRVGIRGEPRSVHECAGVSQV